MSEQQTKPPKAPAGPPRDPKVVTALRRFAMSMTAFNIIGYAYLGFEQPWLWPFIALATAYSVEIGLERLGAHVENRDPRYKGAGFKGLVEFLFPAHITGLAVNMLTYVNDQVLVMMFGVTVAVGTKWILRAPVRGRLRHFMNPSNFGIAVILVIFPWASIAPPYQFTEYTSGVVDWIIPVAIIVAGTMLNAKLTNRMWLIAGWVSFFAIQSIVRGLILDTAILGALGTMTGVAFVLFTNYMITDPGTSPSRPASQFAFGAGVAITYGLYTGMSVTYGLFFATATVCAIRGGFLWSLHIVQKSTEQYLKQQAELKAAKERTEAVAAAAAADGAVETPLAEPVPLRVEPPQPGERAA